MYNTGWEITHVTKKSMYKWKIARQREINVQDALIHQDQQYLYLVEDFQNDLNIKLLTKINIIDKQHQHQHYKQQ